MSKIRFIGVDEFADYLLWCDDYSHLWAFSRPYSNIPPEEFISGSMVDLQTMELLKVWPYELLTNED